MKIITFLIFVACMQVSANGTAQTISLTQHNVSLKSIFKEIEKQTGFQFFYNDRLLEQAKNVSVDFKDATLSQVLDACFKDQPITYAIVEKMVVVKRKEVLPQNLEEDLGVPIGGDIHGRITNAQGQPLENANLIIKRTHRGTVTNSNGEFVLHSSTANDEIIVSFVGYKSQTVKVRDRTNFTLVMEPATNDLDKVVVQAYGITSQRLATGNIGTVRAEDIEKQPVSNPIEALQGRVAGLNIQQTSGYASAPFHVDIRGRNTIDDGISTEPLYIVDGAPLTILQLGGGFGAESATSGFIQNSNFYGPANGQSPFYNINPADIESIEILKDADATAIYGSRGANGVIIITTKKGKAGKTKFDIDAYTGVSVVTGHWNMLNTPQYLQMRREAYHNVGVAPDQGSAPDLLIWDTTRYTNWQKFLWGGIGKNSDVQTTLSGGDARTTFRIGAGYHYMTDITAISGSSQQGSLSFNLLHHTINNRFSVSLTGFYDYSKIDMIELPSVATLSPDAPSVFDKQGNLNYAEWDASQQGFPFASVLLPYSSRTGFLSSSLIFTYEVLKGLSFKTTFGYNNAQSNQSNPITIASQDPAQNPTGIAQFGYNHNTNLSFEPQLQYSSFIQKGKLTTVVGATSQQTNTDALQVSGSGYSNDALLGSLTSALVHYSVNGSGEYKYAAVFGRINYDYKEKYIINLNGRRDGSSRFGPGRQYGNFGSVGVAYIFSEEQVIKERMRFLSFGKLRGSYGTTGSDYIGDYKYLSRWGTSSPTTGALYPYNGVSPLVPTQHADSSYQWQVNKKLEIALDLGFFKDRVSIEVAYYRNRCNNQLVPFPTPEFTGFTSVTANNPADVQNSGFEYIFKANVVDTKNFGWSFSFNTAINRNKLLYYPNLAQSPFATSLKIGAPLYFQYLLHSTGVDPMTGQYSFQDKNHDGQITISTTNPGVIDDRYFYNLTQKFNGGFENKFHYKSLELTLFFYFKKQNAPSALLGIIPGTMMNVPVQDLSHWKKPGDITSNARYTIEPSAADGNYLNYSDGVYTDASFIRLKNLALSYVFPVKIIKQAGLQGMTLFLRSQNVFVITKYKGIDPEITSFGAMPINRTFVGGVSFKF